ncbi:MAG: hypothetical protein AAF739_00750 [Pseudomonadota bacterium]
MPAFFGLAALAVGGFIASRIMRREWMRVNRAMDDTRRAKTTDDREAMPQLKRDPATGNYKPGDES